MRIAVISDVHANYEALKSVIEDIEKSDVDQIICLGDNIGKGVNANKCVNLIKEKCDIVIMGNTDTRFSGDPEKWKHDEVEYSRIKFNKSLLSEENIQYLQSLPFATEFYMSGNFIRMFHAHPTSCFKFVNDYDKSFAEKYKMFEGSDLTPTKEVADIVIYGHLHYPFVQRMFNKTLICCGSVGNSICLMQNDKYNSSPEEVTQAHYIIIEGEYGMKTRSNFSVQIKSVGYDIQKELESNKGVNFEYDSYATELQEGRYRNMSRVNQSFIDQGYDINF